MTYALRMTEAQHTALRSHLFPGDGQEALALLLCGRREGPDRHVLTVRQIVTIPHDLCNRRADRITWPTDAVDPLIRDAFGKGLAIVKVHSHGSDYRRFSGTDDASDHALFSSITSLLDDGLPHASLIMLPDGELFGRILGDGGGVIATIASIMAVGDDIRFWGGTTVLGRDEFTLRHTQAFGRGTTDILRRFSVAIVGCSGTGSIVVEQIARLGVGRLVLVDPDAVEKKNLNRILNSGMDDARAERAKVDVLADAIRRLGLNQDVLPLRANLIEAETVRRVAECDVVFGCMDGVEGRHTLNRLATFYTLPYFDVGVRLDADGRGGIDKIAGAVHYLQPGRSSLLSRGVYDMRRVEAEETRRTDPEMYRRQVKEGYLRGINEDRPAVISVNMFFAALVVNDFLARIHPYRNEPNGSFAYTGGSLSEMQFYPEPETEPCPMLSRHVGKGDVVPLLERPALS